MTNYYLYAVTVKHTVTGVQIRHVNLYQQSTDVLKLIHQANYGPTMLNLFGDNYTYIMPVILSHPFSKKDRQELLGDIGLQNA